MRQNIEFAECEPHPEVIGFQRGGLFITGDSASRFPLPLVGVPQGAIDFGIVGISLCRLFVKLNCAVQIVRQQGILRP